MDINQGNVQELFNFIETKYLVRKTRNSNKFVELEVYGFSGTYMVPTGCLIIRYDKVNEQLEVDDFNSKNYEVVKELISDIKTILNDEYVRKYSFRKNPKMIITHFSLTDKDEYVKFFDESIKEGSILEVDDSNKSLVKIGKQWQK